LFKVVVVKEGRLVMKEL